MKLTNNTEVSEDHKSGIITLAVIDHDRNRAAAIAQAYIEELGKLVAELSTSAAHRERVFLEERIKAVKLDLDDASRQFSEFSSKNKTIDSKEQGRAMVEAAAALQGQLDRRRVTVEGVATDLHIKQSASAGIAGPGK